MEGGTLRESKYGRQLRLLLPLELQVYRLAEDNGPEYRTLIFEENGHQGSVQKVQEQEQLYKRSRSAIC